jgi:FAD/FMN-containing dehydrogenase
VRAEVDPWGIEDGPELELMRRVKGRFDPAGVLV